MNSFKTKIITLAFPALAALTLASGCTHEKPPIAAITMDQARQTALGAVPGGTIKTAEYEKEAGQWVYIFEVTMASGVREIQIDPQSGAILKNVAD